MRIERRKHQRYPLSLELRLAAASGKHEVRLSDLSFGGCYIDSIGQVFVGEKVSFEINVPTLQWVPFGGTVTYTHAGFGFGVSFAPLNSVQEAVVAQLVGTTVPAAVAIPAQLHSYAA
jgi:hypothetical protein